MAERYFNIKRDNMLIAKGSHFWCHACVVARPLVEQSPDSRYCKPCQESLKIEAEIQRNSKTAWMPKNTGCETALKATQTTPAMQGVVLQHPDHDKDHDKELCNTRGRPRKVGAVHRATRWRRAKQGVLI